MQGWYRECAGLVKGGCRACVWSVDGRVYGRCVWSPWCMVGERRVQRWCRACAGLVQGVCR